MKNNKEVMLALRESGLTLNEIGILFGVTRERVRQIIGNTGLMAAEVRRNAIVDSPYEETNEQVSYRLGLSQKTVENYRRNSPKRFCGGQIAVSQEYTEKIAALLITMGFEVMIVPRNSGFDLTVNNNRVSVSFSSSDRENPPSKHKLRNKQYIFHIPNHADKPIDFFIFMAGGVDNVFIVPHSTVPRKMNEVVFVWPTSRPEIGKYQQYHNRYDLLR